jgi:small subunit ribosomal protein S17
MKIFKGEIVSLKSQNTAVVSIERKAIHPLYKKVLRRNKKHKADTNGVEVKLGDQVKIVETRPISKQKHFKITEVIK